MAITTARRLSTTSLELRGAALDTVMAMAAIPYDLHHPHNRAASEAFYPAREYVKLLGHATRAYIDPDGWVRDAAFEFRLTRMVVDSDGPSPLDSLLRQVEHLLPSAGEPNYMFHYLHADADGIPIFDPGDLSALPALQMDKILAADATPGGRAIIAGHRKAIDDAFTDYLSGRLDSHLRVSLIEYSITLLGFAYERAAHSHLDQRSTEEVSEAKTAAGRRITLPGRPAPRAPFTPVSSKPPTNPGEIEISPGGWKVADELPVHYPSMESEREETAPDETVVDEWAPAEEEVSAGVIFTETPAKPIPLDIDSLLDEVIANPSAPTPLAGGPPPAEDDPLSFLDE